MISSLRKLVPLLLVNEVIEQSEHGGEKCHNMSRLNRPKSY